MAVLKVTTSQSELPSIKIYQSFPGIDVLQYDSAPWSHNPRAFIQTVSKYLQYFLHNSLQHRTLISSVLNFLHMTGMCQNQRMVYTMGSWKIPHRGNTWLPLKGQDYDSRKGHNVGTHVPTLGKQEAEAMAHGSYPMHNPMLHNLTSSKCRELQLRAQKANKRGCLLLHVSISPRDQYSSDHAWHLLRHPQTIMRSTGHPAFLKDFNLPPSQAPDILRLDKKTSAKHMDSPKNMHSLPCVQIDAQT